MKKKILFVIPYLSDGGAERALSNITTHWPDDWDIDILVNNTERIDYEYKGNIISLGIKGRKTGSLCFQFVAFLRRTKELVSLKKSSTYRACISFLDSCNIANIISGNKRCKVIVSVRSSISRNSKFAYKYIVIPLVKKLYNRADAVTAVSDELRGELISIFNCEREKTIAITNGYDISKMLYLAQKTTFFSEYKGKNVVVTSGRLSDPKRQWHLVKAMKLVKETIPDVLLLIAGEGELRSKLESLIEMQDLKDNVFLLGHVEAMYELLSIASVFVLPSGWEGFPNSLAEAICMNVPCIATDFSTGSREILAPELLIDKDGVIYRNNEKKIDSMYMGSFGIITPLCSGKKESDFLIEESEIELAKAIVTLLTDCDLYEHYVNCCKEKSSKLSIDRAVKQWIDVI